MKVTFRYRDMRKLLSRWFVLIILLGSIANAAAAAEGDDEDDAQEIQTELSDINTGENQQVPVVTGNETSWLTTIMNSGFVIPTNITSDCKRDVHYFIEALFTRKHGGPVAKWTLRALDSFGKLPSGVMDGDFSWLGRYRECIDLEVHKNESQSDKPDFTGKYCLTFIVIVDDKGQPIPTPIFPKCGMCFPSTCTEDDISKMVNMYTAITPIRFAIPKRFCQVKDEHHWESKNIFAMFIICILVGLVTFGTIQDIRNEWQEEMLQGRKLILNEPSGAYKTFEPILLAFSFRKSMASIFSVSKEDGNPMDCFHGFRLLSTIWVIVVHIFVMGVQDYPWKNILAASSAAGNNFWVQIITAATLSSDSFFFMSGMLVCYHCLHQLKQLNGRFNLAMFYLHRYFRIIPAYAMTVLIIGGLLIKMGDGPLWPMLTDSTVKCATSWWKNMLFIQNLWGSFYDQCFLPSWYLAVDFQMYLLSPFFLLPLFRNPRYGLTLVWLGLIVTIIMPGVLVYAYDMESYTGRQSRAANMDLWTNMVYEKPWNRMSSYFIGMLLGYVIYSRGFKIRLPRVVIYLGWMTCMCIICLIVFGPYEYFKGKLMTRKMYAFYGAFARPAWAACMAWIIFACVTGHGGIVNSVLGWKPFAPLSRLCYCTYLIHLPAVHYIMYSANEGIYLQLAQLVVMMVGMIAISFCCGLIMSVLTEAPMLQIEKLVLKKYLPQAESSKPVRNSEDTEKHQRASKIITRNESYLNGNSTSLMGSTARRRI